MSAKHTSVVVRRATLIVMVIIIAAITIVELAAIAQPSVEFITITLRSGPMWVGLFPWLIFAGGTLIDASNYGWDRERALSITLLGIGSLMSLAGIFIGKLFEAALWANFGMWLTLLVYCLRNFRSEWKWLADSN
jgi:hypothetical protein